MAIRQNFFFFVAASAIYTDPSADQKITFQEAFNDPSLPRQITIKSSGDFTKEYPINFEFSEDLPMGFNGALHRIGFEETFINPNKNVQGLKSEDYQWLPAEAYVRLRITATNPSPIRTWKIFRTDGYQMRDPVPFFKEPEDVGENKVYLIKVSIDADWLTERDANNLYCVFDGYWFNALVQDVKTKSYVLPKGEGNHLSMKVAEVVADYQQRMKDIAEGKVIPAIMPKDSFAYTKEEFERLTLNQAKLAETFSLLRNQSYRLSEVLLGGGVYFYNYSSRNACFNTGMTRIMFETTIKDLALLLHHGVIKQVSESTEYSREEPSYTWNSKLYQLVEDELPKIEPKKALEKPEFPLFYSSFSGCYNKIWDMDTEPKTDSVKKCKVFPGVDFNFYTEQFVVHNVVNFKLGVNHLKCRLELGSYTGFSKRLIFKSAEDPRDYDGFIADCGIFTPYTEINSLKQLYYIVKARILNRLGGTKFFNNLTMGRNEEKMNAFKFITLPEGVDGAFFNAYKDPAGKDFERFINSLSLSEEEKSNLFWDRKGAMTSES